MKKKKFGLTIEKGKLLIITSLELNSFMLANELTDETQGQINEVRKRFKSAGIILFFLNYNNQRYTLDCFLPIFNSQSDFAKFKIGPGKEGGPLLIFPILLEKSVEKLIRNEIEAIVNKVFRFANWSKEYGFGVQEDGMPVTQIDIAPYAQEPISQGVIEFWTEQLEFYKTKALKQPEFKPYLYELVKDIEDMRRERDAVTGFRDLQISAHDFALRLSNVIDGKFDARCFEQFYEFVNNFFKNIHNSLSTVFSINITPAYGSAILLVDLVPEKGLPPEINERWETGKKHLTKTVGAMPNLVQKGDPKERVNNFCAEANLEPEQADKVLNAAKKLFPASGSKKNAIEIYSQSTDEPLATFNEEGSDYFVKAKKDLSDSLKPIEDTIISGYIGIIVGWEDTKMKFTILTDEGRRLTIKYSQEQTEEVRTRFKKNVKLERAKEGRGWSLVGWR
ncbi:hypothetical protein AGMMS49942_13010 [Spirochaetia bacterium]|nr:hypothetical protein AGMMS49942_13010 [Spirochaetia bacterium]